MWTERSFTALPVPWPAFQVHDGNDDGGLANQSVDELIRELFHSDGSKARRHFSKTLRRGEESGERVVNRQGKRPLGVGTAD